MFMNSHFAFKLRSGKVLILSLVLACFTVYIFLYRCKVYSHFDNKLPQNIVDLHKLNVERFYQIRKAWNTSKLGAILFKNEEYPAITENNRRKIFVVLIWKHWKFLQNRHVFYFGNSIHDPLEGCSVRNCIFTGDEDKLGTADAVVVHVQRALFPQVNTRNRTQRWIFLNDEAPHNAFSVGEQTRKIKINYNDLNNLFNWSMTYSTEADVPVPYGRTVPLASPKFILPEDLTLNKLVPNWENKTRDPLVADLLSDCGVPYRMQLIKKLQKYMNVDVHGKCGEEKYKNSCPGWYRSDCEVLSKYIFYLALENSKCKDYITEKLFYNAYYRGAIPIIQGPSIGECEKLLPPHSFLHVDNYATVEDLADDIKRISDDDDALLSYHEWRNHFEVANEHGYFRSKSFHLCRVCQAMNYNDESEKIYSKADLARFFDSEIMCREKIRRG